MSEAKAEAQAAETGAKLSGIAIAGVLILIVVLVGIAIYVSFPVTNNHFTALVAIGVLGLVVSVLAVLVAPGARDPAIPRAASAGSFWFGVAVLLGAGLVAPDGAFGGAACSGSGVGACGITFGSVRIVYLIIVLFLVVAGLLYMRWQLGGRARDVRREASRDTWRKKTGVGAGSPGTPSPNDPRMNPP